MTYVLATQLQGALFRFLRDDPDIQATGAEVFDALPEGDLPSLYILLGEETARDQSDQSGAVTLHDFTLTVVTDRAGFQSAKQVAEQICTRLEASRLSPDEGQITGLWFLRARARAEHRGVKRQVQLWFRARLEA